MTFSKFLNLFLIFSLIMPELSLASGGDSFGEMSSSPSCSKNQLSELFSRFALSAKCPELEDKENVQELCNCFNKNKLGVMANIVKGVLPPSFSLNSNLTRLRAAVEYRNKIKEGLATSWSRNVANVFEKIADLHTELRFLSSNDQQREAQIAESHARMNKCFAMNVESNLERYLAKNNTCLSNLRRMYSQNGNTPSVSELAQKALASTFKESNFLNILGLNQNTSEVGKNWEKFKAHGTESVGAFQELMRSTLRGFDNKREGNKCLTREEHHTLKTLKNIESLKRVMQDPSFTTLMNYISRGLEANPVARPVDLFHDFFWQAKEILKSGEDINLPDYFERGMLSQCFLLGNGETVCDGVNRRKLEYTKLVQETYPFSVMLESDDGAGFQNLYDKLTKGFQVPDNDLEGDGIRQNETIEQFIERKQVDLLAYNEIFNNSSQEHRNQIYDQLNQQCDDIFGQSLGDLVCLNTAPLEKGSGPQLGPEFEGFNDHSFFLNYVRPDELFEKDLDNYYLYTEFYCSGIARASQLSQFKCLDPKDYECKCRSLGATLQYKADLVPICRCPNNKTISALDNLAPGVSCQSLTATNSLSSRLNNVTIGRSELELERMGEASSYDQNNQTYCPILRSSDCASSIEGCKDPRILARDLKCFTSQMDPANSDNCKNIYDLLIARVSRDHQPPTGIVLGRDIDNYDIALSPSGQRIEIIPPVVSRIRQAIAQSSGVPIMLTPPDPNRPPTTRRSLEDLFSFPSGDSNNHSAVAASGSTANPQAVIRPPLSLPVSAQGPSSSVTTNTETRRTTSTTTESQETQEARRFVDNNLPVSSLLPPRNKRAPAAQADTTSSTVVRTQASIANTHNELEDLKAEREKELKKLDDDIKRKTQQIEELERRAQKIQNNQEASDTNKELDNLRREIRQKGDEISDLRKEIEVSRRRSETYTNSPSRTLAGGFPDINSTFAQVQAIIAPRTSAQQDFNLNENNNLINEANVARVEASNGVSERASSRLQSETRIESELLQDLPPIVPQNVKNTSSRLSQLDQQLEGVSGELLLLNRNLGQEVARIPIQEGSPVNDITIIDNPAYLQEVIRGIALTLNEQEGNGGSQSTFVGVKEGQETKYYQVNVSLASSNTAGISEIQVQLFNTSIQEDRVFVNRSVSPQNLVIAPVDPSESQRRPAARVEELEAILEETGVRN